MSQQSKKRSKKSTAQVLTQKAMHKCHHRARRAHHKLSYNPKCSALAQGMFVLLLCPCAGHLCLVAQLLALCTGPFTMHVCFAAVPLCRAPLLSCSAACPLRRALHNACLFCCSALVQGTCSWQLLNCFDLDAHIAALLLELIKLQALQH